MIPSALRSTLKKAFSCSEAVTHSKRTMPCSGRAVKSTKVIGSGFSEEMDAKVHGLNNVCWIAVGIFPASGVPAAPPLPRSRQMVPSQRATIRSGRSVTHSWLGPPR